MSSIIKNTINRFEEYVGDATNLHTRFPMLVLGFMMLIPVHQETFREGQPTDGLQRIAELLERSNARRVITEPSGSYEVSCLLLVDFEPIPPRLSSMFPPTDSTLRVESFFRQAHGAVQATESVREALSRTPSGFWSRTPDAVRRWALFRGVDQTEPVDARGPVSVHHGARRSTTQV